MSTTEPGKRNRTLLASLLSTRAGPVDEAAVLALADRLEGEGLLFSRWQVDGPAVRVLFHGPDCTLSATIRELERVAHAHQAGDTTVWKTLLLPEGQASDRRPPLPETLS